MSYSGCILFAGTLYVPTSAVRRTGDNCSPRSVKWLFVFLLLPWTTDARLAACVEPFCMAAVNDAI